MNWYPDRQPSPSRFAGVSTDDALRMCEALGVTSLTVIATASSDVPVPELAEHFGRVCDRAAGFGAQVHLEFMPFTVVRNLRIAWDLVRGADRPNGGLVFDTWHFFRGEPQFDVLAGIPGDRIFCVQLDDAAAVPQGSLREETSRRLLPGDGALDLVGCRPGAAPDRRAALGRPGGNQPRAGGHAGAGRRHAGDGTDPGDRGRGARGQMTSYRANMTGYLAR